MCEWLSREEWCDVRLLCGGRAFGAHRAVLASVSSFLRRILLSCPIEESPTLIVLPDFDIEALSAVLYYVYNGEVTMPRQKLDKFLDIIKAMQIFIDRQYFTQLSLHIDIHHNLNKAEDKRIFVLRSEADDNSSLVTFRKLFQHTLPETKDATDYTDMQARNWNEQFKPVLGNLQSAYGDRQRDYFLRDSFMETYPRNRNANGLASGVPAIPNRCYRSPTSLLLTNANVNGCSTDTANLSYDNTDTASQAYNLKMPSNRIKPYQDNMILTEFRRKLSANFNDFWTSPESKVSMETLQDNDGKPPSLDISNIRKTYTAIPYSIANSKIVIDKLPWYSCSEYTANAKIKRSSNSTTREMCHNKVAILNKALDNPWCPRLPNSFRPFRRKGHNLDNFHLNDSNNNVQTTPSIVKDERAEGVTDVHSNGDFASSLDDDKEFASIQTSTELSSRGRYTCNECGKTFSQLRNFKYHMSVHRGTREFAASCSVCGKSFNDRGYLSSHMKIHRNRKEYKCPQCPKSFNQRVAYNMHVRIHTGVKPHVCPTCGKAFSRKMLLKQHQRTHSGERPYACPHCDKRFADRSNMTLHLRLHTGVKPFKCPMCPKSFTKKHHLKSHVNFHTGAKPYSCPRCHLAFTQSSNMRTHFKRCTAPELTDVTIDNAS